MIDRIPTTGASIVRIPIRWASVAARASADDPAPRDPANPGYNWQLVDSDVKVAVAAGLTPMVEVHDAPPFAEAQPAWRYSYPNVWSPSPAAFGDFAAAVARRYDGSFPDPQAPGRALPRVRYLQAWNEPNLPRFLEPQWLAARGRWLPWAPAQYRSMLNAFYRAVKEVAPGDIVVMAGLAPNGDVAGVGRMSPVAFLRSFLCMDRSGGCGDPPHFDVAAFHPLSFRSPDAAAVDAGNVAISDLQKVIGILHEARHRGRILPRGGKPLWVTELNWESNPPLPTGVVPRLQAPWVSRALHRLWLAGAALVAWEFMRDPVGELAGPAGTSTPIDRPAGLFSSGPAGPQTDTPRPFFYAFRFPFDPLRRDRGHVRVWALLPTPGPARAVLERRQRGRWRRLATVRVSRDGIVNQLVTLHGAARLRLTDESAGPSPSATVGSRPFR